MKSVVPPMRHSVFQTADPGEGTYLVNISPLGFSCDHKLGKQS